jgi:CheY-like chemotaxis protein
VLVVDHDVRRLLALTPRLEGWGLEVLAAGDAEEALESLEDDVALVIAGPDVSAPEPYATIRRMRQDPRMQAVPVIALCDPEAADAAPDRTLRLALPLDWHALHALLERQLSGPAP